MRRALLLLVLAWVGVAHGQGADNIYYPASGVPTWGSADGPASLPLAGYNTALANTPATGSVVNVSTASQLTTALAAAACGQQITLQAGNTFSGHFTIPALSCPATNYLWIQSSAMSSLPPEGSRTSPCYSGVTSLPGRPAFNCPGVAGTYTALIVSPDTAPSLTFTAGTSGVRIMGIEFGRTTGVGYVADIVKLGEIGSIDHVIFDRVWCHGTENADETGRCFDMSAVSYVAAIDGYYSNFYCATGAGHVSCDAQAMIAGLNTVNGTVEGVVKIVNNWLEGAAETIEVGGGAANTVPTDFEIRLNTCFKPLPWNPSDPSYNGGLGGDPLVVKNLFEFKNGNRVLFEGNTLQNVWAGFTQNGSALLLTPKNQQNGAVNQCPICAVTNITYRYNVINTAGAPMQFAVLPNGNGAYSAGASNWSIHDIVADNLQYSTCYTCTDGVPTIQLWEGESIPSFSQRLHDVSVNHTTSVYASTATVQVAALGLSGNLISTGFEMSNISFTNNAMWSGSTGTANEIGSGITTNCAYGVTTGTNMINACWVPYTFGGNCFINNGSTAWPGTNVTSLATQTAAFVNYNNGNGGNYTIAAGACKGAATDGTDPGANLTVLASVLAGNPAPENAPAALPIMFTENLARSDFWAWLTSFVR